MNECVKVACINIRSLLPKIRELDLFLNHSVIDVMVVVETWLNDSIRDSDLHISNYNIVRSDRAGRGGGVCIYFNKNLSYSVIDASGNIEQLWLSFRWHNCRFVVGGVYKPPTVNYKYFIDELENSLVSLLPISDSVYCLGDFNIDCLNLTSPSTDYFLQFLDSVGLKQIIEQPTRLTRTSATLIDLILVSNDSLINDKGVVDCGFSDHDLVYFTFRVGGLPRLPAFRSYRDFKNVDWELFNAELTGIPFHRIFYMSDINSKVEYFNYCLLNHFDRHAPMITRRFTKPYAPWITDNVKLLISLRNKAKSRFRRSRRPGDWNYYRSLRNLTTNTIRLEKKAFFEHVFREGDCRSLWRSLGHLGIGGGAAVDVPPHLNDVDRINQYFINNLPISSGNIGRASAVYDGMVSDLNFSFKPVETSAVWKVIAQIKSKSCGHDNVNISMIKMCCPTILPFVTHIINFCICESVFPECWKLAVVRPLPKISNPLHMKDLRPISLLPVVSKVFEKIISAQLAGFLRDNDILPSTQSGFRAGFGCETALLSVTDDLIAAADGGLISCLVLLDYTKAFDTIDHSVLLSVLRSIGLGDEAVGLMASYVRGRRQVVRLGESVSADMELSRGVPQGSVIGPILFTLYASKLLTCVRHCKYHVYADDTQLYYSFRPSEWRAAVKDINIDLECLYRISLDHCLQINPLKSQVALFGSRKTCVDLTNVLDVKVNGESIPIVEKVKSLGVFLDRTFRYRDQISKYIKNSYINLKKLYPYKNILNQTIKKQLCDTLVLSHFDYCCSVYHGALDSFTAARIQKIQNACVRYIYSLRKYDHISQKLNETGWLNMHSRREYRMLCLFHKVILYRTPPYLYRRIRFRCDVHNLTTRFRGLISPPAFRTALFQRSFSYQIYCRYNRVSPDLKSHDIRDFKRCLKRDLLHGRGG